MDGRQRILWVDCIGALIVGPLLLVGSPWLSGWHGLPFAIVVAIGVANVGYGLYSLSLARSPRRSVFAVQVLAIANMTWTLVCVALYLAFLDDVTYLGTAQLLAEGAYVGWLGAMEWRNRHCLAS